MLDLNEEDQKKSEQALVFIKANRALLLERFVGSKSHAPEEFPISLFMAGSPGAGKTETATALLEGFEHRPIHIDTDAIRELCPGYDGGNSSVYQRAAVKGVNMLFDFALEKNISLLLDGTFAYAQARGNVERSLHHNRRVTIYFVHQDPKQAWEVTKAREAIKKRWVPREVFIDATMMAREYVDNIMKEFAGKVELNVILKDFATGMQQLISNVPGIDPAVVPIYTKTELEQDTELSA